MLLLGQREIKQHTLVMKWRNAKIIHLFIIVYPLRRFEIHIKKKKHLIYHSHLCFVLFRVI